ncbi:PREDICTED: E3 ubiquitin-ligase [Prunus dulcis]|uniref:E3 ubiquitin-protein ligase RMA n=2 Tax=Prunus dulcis TaxID=3755 RepID=A0A5E4FRU5_PRUDU|nr:hypothetical protein L3X38_013029 [Prunus dulcis]VVA30215.1 PREDICTED: E3 ubiquitin-ligase [Prunus dulcis]
MASSNEIKAPLKPPMSFMLPHEIFHGPKPAHEWYEHMDNHDYDDNDEEEEEEEEVGYCLFHNDYCYHNDDDGDGDEDYDDGYDEDDEDDDDDDDDSVFSLLVQDEIDQHEFESFTSDHYYTPSLDGHDQDPTVHQDDDQDPTLYQDGDYDEGYLTVPLSPPRSVLYFDCNMCMKVAREPVVTSCGHLYCWPCLYSWLNIYSAHRECLVCKSKVFDSLITPIYNCRDINSGFKMPPRPEPKGLRLS